MSLLGIQVYTIVSTWEAARIGGIAAATAVGLASAIPRVIVLFVGGPITDLLGPRFLLLRSDLLSAAVMLGGAILVPFIDALPLLILLSAVIGSLAGIAGPAGGSMLPSLVTKDKLPAMNSWNLLAVRGAAVLGPAIGAVFISAGGLSIGMLFNAGAYLTSFALVLSIKPGNLTTNPGPKVKQAIPRKSLRISPFSGYRAVLAAPISRWLLIGVFLLDLGFAWPFNVGLTLMVQHRDWGGGFVGAAISSFAVGAILSSLLGSKILGSRWIITRLAAGQLTVALGLAGMLLAPGIVLWTAAAALCGIGSGQAGPMAVSLYQQTVNSDYIGSAMAALTLCSIGTAPLALAISSSIAAMTSIPTAWLASTCIILLAPLAAIRVRALQSKASQVRPSPPAGAAP